MGDLSNMLAMPVDLTEASLDALCESILKDAHIQKPLIAQPRLVVPPHIAKEIMTEGSLWRAAAIEVFGVENIPAVEYPSRVIVLDDPVEGPFTDEQRATAIAWWEKHMASRQMKDLRAERLARTPAQDLTDDGEGSAPDASMHPPAAEPKGEGPLIPKDEDKDNEEGSGDFDDDDGDDDGTKSAGIDSGSDDDAE